MIDPSTISNYNLSPEQLEENLIFWMLVAGKNATTAARKCQEFIDELYVWYGTSDWSKNWGEHRTPFFTIREALRDSRLREIMETCKLGKYNVLEKGLRAVVWLDLKTCTLEQLEAVPGIGPKTARCFLLHTRPNQRLAGIDTHILKWLREKGYDVPTTTPPVGKKYRELEQIFLDYADLYGLSAAELDLKIWNHYARGTSLDLPQDALRQAA